MHLLGAYWPNGAPRVRLGVVAKRWVILIGALLAIVLAGAVFPSPAFAQSKSQREATALKKQGDAAYDSMRYAEALDAYNQSYEAYPDPRLFYNRGRAHAAMSQYPEALEQLVAFKTKAPKRVLRKVPQLDSLIMEVRSKVSILRLKSDVGGARVVLRDRVIGQTPLPPTKVNAGRAVLEVTADGRLPFKKSIELRGGRETTISVDLPPLDSRARLLVRSPIAGARVSVDGRVVGVVPAETQVDPGKHIISVTHADYSDAETTTFVKAGETKDLTIDLDKSSAITSKWWFWTGVGVVVVAGVVTVVALNTEKDADSGTIPPGQVAVPLFGF